MTQEQIATGLECCTYKTCKDGCPYYGEAYCRISLMLAALGLIQQQKQEIDGLKAQKGGE